MKHHRAVVLSTLLVLLATGVAAGNDQTPANAIERLKAGNATFVRDPAAPLPVNEETRLAQINGQTPFAMVVSCADSRVPPEVIFHAGLGELFIVRTAGQVTDKAVLASVEYGAEHLNVPLLVVMGHESCGAVKTAVGIRAGAPSMGPNLDALIAAIKPAFERMTGPADLDHLRDAILANVEQVVNNILTDSAVVKHLVGAGKLQVVGASYEIATGRVRFSQPLGAESVPVHLAASAHK